MAIHCAGERAERARITGGNGQRLVLYAKHRCLDERVCQAGEEVLHGVAPVGKTALRRVLIAVQVLWLQAAAGQRQGDGWRGSVRFFRMQAEAESVAVAAIAGR